MKNAESLDRSSVPVVGSGQVVRVPSVKIRPSRGLFHLDLRALWQYRELLVFLVWRDIKVRYKQAVIGAGWAVFGLTLARQLKLELPELSVAVIDRLTAPLPEAAFKVGESSIELGTYYFGQALQLDHYFRTRHLPKLGLRFFMGDAQGPLTARPETGQSMFPPVPSYQIDRGRLETDLREFVVKMGVILFEGTTVEDIELSDGDAAHVVR